MQGDTVLLQTALDLTVYLEKPTTEELNELVALYRQICPPDRFLKYKIAEVRFSFDDIEEPKALTRQGRQAHQAGEPLPFLVPVRSRITAGRPFELQFWDGQKVKPHAFSFRQIRLEGELHSFLRVLIPLDYDPNTLWGIAQRIADRVQIISGHGGLVFLYDPGEKFDAFTQIYDLATRWWGVEVEDLNLTLPLMKTAIKGANWITMLGPRFLETVRGTVSFENLKQEPDIKLLSAQNAQLIRAGDKPAPCDRDCPDPSMDPYIAVARALEPLYLESHESFRGHGFLDNGKTLGWYRRFLDPAGWP